MADLPKQLAQFVTTHAWNKDRTKLAFTPNNNEIHVWSKVGAAWEPEHILKEHDESQIVTGIDWAPETNRIVTSSQDRNAYVWTFQPQTNQWKPTLVILRINRAATSVKWSPNEDKFAVSSGAKCVSICYFEVENDWWVSKHIKKHKSTILNVDWHPNNILILTSSTDFKTRVFSAFIKGVDKKPGETAFGNKLPLGELLGEYTSTSWVHCAKWSPSGNRFASLTHEASVTFVDVTAGKTDEGFPGKSETVRLKDLPLIDFLWINENAVVAVGHDCNPFLFNFTNGAWSLTRKMDDGAGGAAGKKPAEASNRAAFDMFKNKVEVGTNTNVTALQTRHQNTITSIQPYKFGANRDVLEFTTTGLDGQLEHWKV